MTKNVKASPSGGGPDDDDNTVPDGDPDNHDGNPRRGTPSSTSFGTHSDSMRRLESFDATSRVPKNSRSKFYPPGTAPRIDDINSNLAADPR
jgi:hypothetical protein